MKKLILFFGLILTQLGLAQNIVNPEDYDYWRSLAQTNPMYAQMKQDALNNSHNAENMSFSRDVTGSSALAYILDPENKEKYVENIHMIFKKHVMNIYIGKEATTSSTPSGELFFALLALDVMGSDIDPESLKIYEESLKEKIMKLVIGQWDPHAWAMRMLWYKYVGDDENFQAAKEEWLIGLSEHYLDDGTSPAGSGYCVERWNDLRCSAKNTTADLMTYMGDYDAYSNTGLVMLQDFIYGHANAPFGHILAYGDSRQLQDAWDIEGDMLVSATILRSRRYSEQAYKYAMWIITQGYETRMSELKVKGYLLSYLVLAGSAKDNNPVEIDLNDAEPSPSCVLTNYATLRTKDKTTNELAIAMQNLTGNIEYHTHYEVNALALAGYGEILLRNAGYMGPNRDATIDGITSSFKYMHDSSISSNCVMVADKNHLSKVGEGIIDGFTGCDIEYFRGSTGEDVVIEGSHLRDVILMHQTGGANAYFLVMDHLKARDSVNIIWHPNAAVMQQIAPETEYLSEIKVAEGALGPVLYSENEATLTTFLATQPNTIDIVKVVNQEARNDREYQLSTSYVAEYMKANYAPKNGQLDALTILFPGDKDHKAGKMTRIMAEDYSGAEILQGKIKDIALVSSGTTKASFAQAGFKAEDVVFRSHGNKAVSYFVKGEFFELRGMGFQSDSSVSIFFSAEDNSGIVSSPETTTLNIFAPRAKTFESKNPDVKVVSTEGNNIKVVIPAGKTSFRL